MKVLLLNGSSRPQGCTYTALRVIVGLKGERVVNNFKFYAVFQDNEEYKVRCESQELGTIVKPPLRDDKITNACL